MENKLDQGKEEAGRFTDFKMHFLLDYLLAETNP